MKRRYPWSIFAAILLFSVSCKDSDPIPEDEDAETSIVIGNTENLSVISINDEMNLVSSDQDVVILEVDIDGDQINDLMVTSQRIDDQTQLLLIQSADELKVPFLSETFSLSNSIYNYLSLAEEGVEIEKDNLDWTSNQDLLLAYRHQNTSTTPYPSPMNNDVYLPINDGKKLGWLTFNVSRNETSLILESISIKEYVYAELE